MAEAWFQLWADIPLVGRQWVGWLKTTPLHASALSVALQGCPGVGYTILDADGRQVQGMPGNLGDYLPGLGNYFPGL